jgi:ribosomal protein L25 (general stress protein Ctc)
MILLLLLLLTLVRFAAVVGCVCLFLKPEKLSKAAQQLCSKNEILTLSIEIETTNVSIKR